MTRTNYLVRNPRLLVALRVADCISAVLARLRPISRSATPPRRILLANIAHMGDLLISTSVIGPLRDAFPDAEIGMLVGSWNRHVLEGHPDIARIHVFDHVFLNRTRSPRWHRLWWHARTWVHAWQDIRAVKYDTVIDTSCYWPNAIALCWATGIPRRIAYGSGGFGPLLTDCLAWIDRDRHMARSQLALLEPLGIGQPLQPRMSLPPVPTEALPRALEPGRYIILHPGTGNPIKEWPGGNWADLARHLAAGGLTLVLTGRGSREAKTVDAIIQAVPTAISLCDALSWTQLRHLIAHARLLVGVDSMAVHLAAASGTPSVGIYGGFNRIDWWRPLGLGTVVTSDIACFPCHTPKGCETNACLSELSPERVLAACQDLLGTTA